jgi:hypothetical protein
LSPERPYGASSMAKFALLLASTLSVTLASQNAMGKDPSMAEDVQGMFGPTVTGAGPVSVAGAIDRVLSGQTEDAGPVVAEIINRSEQVIRVSTLSSRETKWPPSPYSAQALHRGPKPR